MRPMTKKAHLATWGYQLSHWPQNTKMKMQKHRNTNQWAAHTLVWLVDRWPANSYLATYKSLSPVLVPPYMELNEKEYINKYHPKCVPSAGTSQNKKEYKYKHHPKCVPLLLNQVPPGMGLTGPSKSVPTLNHTGCWATFPAPPMVTTGET